MLNSLYSLNSAYNGKMPCSKYIPREIGMPGIECTGLPGCCGAVWGDHVARLATEPAPGTCSKYEYGACIPAELFLQKAQETRGKLGLPEDYYLPPGLTMGTMHVECSRKAPLAMEWPYLFGFIVTDPLLDAIERHRLTGFEKSEVVVKRAASMLLKHSPKITEIVVTGKAGWANTDPPQKIEPPCPVCGRRPTDSMDYQNLELDESQWDGSDIFQFEHPFNGHIFVTQRWVDAIPASKFDGFRYQSVAELLATRRKYLR